jgi:hypothetical protein
MSVFKSQFSRAVAAYLSDNAVIPNPALLVSRGVNTDKDPFLLVDETVDFYLLGIYPGDVVYSEVYEISATVLEILNSTTLLLNADIFPTTELPYFIYGMSSQAGMGQTGCYLYVGIAGDLDVITIGGDRVVFLGAIAGTILPVQVKQLMNENTNAAKIIALF